MKTRNILLLFFSFFIFLRVIILDNDLPPRTVTDIYAIDELYYTIPAFNLYHHGKWIHQDQLPFKTKNDGTTGNSFQNIVTYFTLLLFGNTYYGLRGAAVLVSLFSLLLMYLIFRKLGDKNSSLIFYLLFYAGIEFSFLITSRTNSPVSFRMFGLLSIIYLSLIIKNNKKQSFLLGFLSMSFVFFIYFHNIFIWFAALLAILLHSFFNKKNDWLSLSILYFSGTALALFVFNIFTEVVYNTSLLEHLYNFQVYTIRLSTHGDSFFIKSAKNLLNFFTTNIFRTNISFLFLSLFLFPSFIFSIIRKKRLIDFFILSLILMLIGQSLFENTYHFRRLTILLPMLLFMILIALFTLSDFLLYLKNKRYTYLYKTYFYCLIFFSIFIYYMSNISRYSLGSIGYGLLNFGETFVILNIILFIITLIFTYSYFFGSRITFIRSRNTKESIKQKIMPPKLLHYLYLLLLLPSFYLSLRYILPNFDHRDAMIHFSKEINNEITIGQASFMFRLYNTSKPVLNWYNYEELYEKKYIHNFRKAFENPKINYTIDFYKKSRPFYLEELNSKKLKFHLKKSFLIEKTTIVVLLEKIKE